ncbi:MAG: ABC transporter ATP-binding protein [Deltaproteobacteria bacterium]|jgi:lipoprotein-releasing system ATP-binding protein|nr:ABC transporter ATP-binding protein [Deltaproteobacteria bacterium]MBT4528013.1 ABC transporter ATP-binding protein [Deltaproteobacteria bacterium]
MNNLMRISELKKSYTDGSGNNLDILKGIDLEISENSTLSISGSSGSGKSTLLHILGGLDQPSSGEIFFKNRSLFTFKNKELADWRNTSIGFVFQSHCLLPDFSAIENVAMPAMISGLNKSEALEKALILLKLVNLSERKDHKPQQLSGGEQQRVAIARALINSPQLILADEPTGNLDMKTGDLVGKMLKTVCKNQNTTLIVVTHNPKLATAMDYQLNLQDGLLQKPSY